MSVAAAPIWLLACAALVGCGASSEGGVTGTGVIGDQRQHRAR